jgi:hypothetical protein
MAELISDVFENIEIVAEQASGTSTLVSLSPDRVQEITEGDDDPMFATFVIEGGWSKSKRFWPDTVLQSISEQINGAGEPVVGYQGHIKVEDDSFVFPDIQMQWVKSIIQPSSEKVRLLAKAYILPGTKARDYIKRKLARSVSIRGDATLAPIQGGVQVKEFDLESIDLARPRKAGMKAQLVSVSSEMEGGNSVKPEEIAALQENELRAHNKALVENIEATAKKPLEEKVSEMSAAAEEAQPNADLLEEIRKLLKIDESADVLQVLGTTLSKLKESGKSLRDKVFDGVLEKKFKDAATRNIVKRLLVSEMEDNGDDDGEDDEEKLTKKIEEMVNHQVDSDDDLKKLVSETENAGGRSVNGKAADRSGDKKLEPGYSDENVEVTKGGR